MDLPYKEKHGEQFKFLFNLVIKTNKNKNQDLYDQIKALELRSHCFLIKRIQFCKSFVTSIG